MCFFISVMKRSLSHYYIISNERKKLIHSKTNEYNKIIIMIHFLKRSNKM